MTQAPDTHGNAKDLSALLDQSEHALQTDLAELEYKQAVAQASYQALCSVHQRLTHQPCPNATTEPCAGEPAPGPAQDRLDTVHP
ncbi:hypothetical protein H4R34_002806 [Dimargaris verticillata]|uniref:Uncharacterized protein n=1 Tax=Dimargaris verticillata TaxID=2761393 RepID=A0A9W8B842_9FUNG|nr:hypothetical protein H4R34_002806 [Dimargaris verticillata]